MPEERSSQMRGLKLDARPSAPNYFLSTSGIAAMLTLLLPVLAFFYPILPGFDAKAMVMTELVCFMTLFGVYRRKRALWEGELKRAVRAAKRRSISLKAFGALLMSLFVGFFLASDGASYLMKLLPETLVAKFIVPPLQMLTFWGITFFFSVTAALDYMSKSEKAGTYVRPPYLRADIDLPDLAADLIRDNLQIPAEQLWKVIERERTPGGGIKFVISWTENVQRTTSDGKKVRVILEKKYAVELDIQGRIISLKEHEG